MSFTFTSTYSPLLETAARWFWRAAAGPPNLELTGKIRDVYKKARNLGPKAPLTAWFDLIQRDVFGWHINHRIKDCRRYAYDGVDKWNIDLADLVCNIGMKG